MVGRVSRLAACVSFAASALAVARPATAQTPPPVTVLEVHAPPAAISPEALREAVAHELGALVVMPVDPAATAATPAGAAHLTIVFDAARRLVLTYRDASGREVFRTVAQPSDPTAAVALIAFLAGNLARNETDQVLDELRLRRAPATAPSENVVVAPTAVGSTSAPTVPQITAAPQATAPRVQPPPVYRHRSRLAIYGANGIAVADRMSGITFTSGLTVFRRGIVRLDVEGGLGMTHGRRDDLSLSADRVWLSPWVTLQLPLGPVLRLEPSAGVVAVFESTSYWSNGLSASGNGGTFGGGLGLHGGLTIALAITRHFDVLLRSQWMASAGVASNGTTTLNSIWFGTTGLGFQGRIF
jgi:hypothetical protein